MPRWKRAALLEWRTERRDIAYWDEFAETLIHEYCHAYDADLLFRGSPHQCREPPMTRRQYETHTDKKSGPKNSERWWRACRIEARVMGIARGRRGGVLGALALARFAGGGGGCRGTAGDARGGRARRLLDQPPPVPRTRWHWRPSRRWTRSNCASCAGGLGRQIARTLAGDEGLARRAETLASIPGVGRATAAGLLAAMPEPGGLDAKAAASLAGLAPVARESGQWQGKRFIQGGRTRARRLLHMAAVAATRHNPDLGRKYRDLIGRGKPPKVALVAVMRKLLLLANALLRQNRLWTPRAGDEPAAAPPAEAAEDAGGPLPAPA